MSEELDRRPIAARNTWASQAIAKWLVGRDLSANAISLAGMGAGILAGLFFALTWWLPSGAAIFWVLGAICVQLRLAANMFDGMVAVARGTASPLGELYNEVPDRISDSAVLAGVGIAAEGNWGLGLAAALAAMATAYVRAVGKGAGAKSDFSGPMAKPHRMFLVTVGAVWLAFLPGYWPEQVGVSLPAALLLVITVGSLLTVARRLWRIAQALTAGPA